MCEEKNILIENGPTIKYSIFGKNKIYFPDFYIPKYNQIIEIKGYWTYNRQNMLDKFLSYKNNGYNYKLISSSRL